MTAGRVWRIRDATLPFGKRTLLMGIINVTPDSFSDGGKFLDPKAALSQGEALALEAADILAVGGESTRPGAVPVGADDEWRRVGLLVDALGTGARIPVSIDTYRAETARKALEAGAKSVNDVWGFQKDAEMG